MIMRIVLFYITLLCGLSAFSQKLSPQKIDLGKVKDWNNPIYVFNYQNTTTNTQRFLPIYYQENLEIIVGKMELEAFEYTQIQVRFFTDQFGRFVENIPLYLSTLQEPIVLTISANIRSFHPDALVFCPKMEGESTTQSSFEQVVAVRDADSKRPLTHYDISLYSSTVTIDKSDLEQSAIRFSLSKPDLFSIEVDKQEYELETSYVYIHRHTDTLWIELKKLAVAMEPSTDPPLIDYPTIEKPDSILPDTSEENHLLLQQENDDSLLTNELPTDTAEFTADGSLNSNLFRINHIVFVIDVSASMDKEEKLPLLKYSMIQLLNVMRPEDRISIITYSSSVEIIAEAVTLANKDQLIQRILGLEAKGQSYGAEALDKAFAVAKTNFIVGGNNEVILASDGIFNSPGLSKRRLYRKVWFKNKFNELRVSTIGFGKSPYALDFMNKLAKNGQGNYLRIPNQMTAREVLVVNMMEHSRK